MTSPSADERKRKGYVIPAYAWANEALTALNQCTILASEAGYKVDEDGLALTHKFLTDLIDGLHNAYMRYTKN